MQPWIMFTKHLEGWDLPQIMDGLKRAGVQGADLCVRPGYPVTPENAPTELPRTAKMFADEGLSIPLITTPGDFVSPDMDYAESLFAACGEAGVKFMKLGYWHMEADGYWATLDRCRKHLEGFSKLAEKTGVKAVVHNHSGSTMGLNSCAVMHLMEGFDPKFVGVFADVGHLSMVGEPYPMAFNIVEKYLAAVAFKDLKRKRNADGNWGVEVLPMGLGVGNFPQVMQVLTQMNYQGPISFHCEYGAMPPESIVHQCNIDTRYIQGILDKLGQ